MPFFYCCCCCSCCWCCDWCLNSVHVYMCVLQMCCACACTVRKKPLCVLPVGMWFTIAFCYSQNTNTYFYFYTNCFAWKSVYACHIFVVDCCSRRCCKRSLRCSLYVDGFSFLLPKQIRHTTCRDNDNTCCVDRRKEKKKRILLSQLFFAAITF